MTKVPRRVLRSLIGVGLCARLRPRSMHWECAPFVVDAMERTGTAAPLTRTRATRAWSHQPAVLSSGTAAALADAGVNAGPIPVTLAELKNLIVLMLGDNKLTGKS